MHFSKPLLGTQLDWSNPLNRGCVMHLACNEGHGDKVQDLSLNGNHGTLNNFAFPPTAASGWNPGQNGIGLKLDGTDDHIDCGNNASLNTLTQLTLSTIFKVVSGSTLDMFIAKHTSGTDGSFHIGHNLTGINFTIINSSNNRIDLLTPLLYNDGDEHCITATYDGSKMKIYVDGNKVSEHAQTGHIKNWSANVFIGSFASSGWECNGSIDQPRIQSRAWAAKEVRDYAMNPWQVYLDEDD